MKPRLDVVALPVVLSLFATGASGCAALGQLFRAAFTEPTLRFQSAQVGNFTLSDATVNLTWIVENPNPVGLSLASFDYGLFVEGNQVVAGAPPLGLRISPQGESTVTFPATVRFADLGPVLTTFLEKDTAAYRASGSLGLQTPIGVVQLPLQHEGTFEVPKVPKVELLAPRITRLDLTSATVELALNLTNRNTYELPIGDLAGTVSIAGAPIGTVQAQKLGLSPSGTRELRLPLTLQFAQAGSAALALQRGAAQVVFEGSLTSGQSSIPLKFQQNFTFRR